MVIFLLIVIGLSGVRFALLLYIQFTAFFSDWPKTYCEFSKSAPRASFSYRLYNDTIIMSRTFKVTGNHVTYDRGALFLSFYTFGNKLSFPLAVMTTFFFVQCIVKQLLDSVL